MESSYRVFADFPKKISGALAWTAADFESEDEFTDYLTTDDVAEINAAIKHFLGLGLVRGLVSPKTFPLSDGLATRLRAITDHVYKGKGFHRLRGLNPESYTETENIILYAGLTSYVADKRARNIDHMRDMSNDPAAVVEELKPPELAQPMSFHTDVDTGDMLSMFIQRPSLQGGDQFIAPMASIYNDLMDSNPETLRLLTEDWYWERAYREAPYEEGLRTYNRPLIGFDGDQLQVHMAKTFLGGNPNLPLSPEAPTLSEEKHEALRAVHEAATRAALRITPQAGDMIFLNNFALIHGRSAFVDSPDDVLKQRYVMRLWLHDTEKGWNSAPALKRNLSETFDLDPESQGLYTGEEWKAIPHGMRIKQMGIHSGYCHD